MAKKSPVPLNLPRAENHILRRQILTHMAAEEPISPNRLSVALAAPLGNVSYHMKTLLECGAVELHSTEPRRGAVEHFYVRVEAMRGRVTDSEALDKVARLLATTPDLVEGDDEDVKTVALRVIQKKVAETGREVGKS